MPNRIFVDTSFVIALINDKDQYYDQAQALSYEFDNSHLITTDAVLLEIGNALAKHFKNQAIAEQGLSSKEAAHLMIRSGLMIRPQELITARGLTQALRFLKACNSSSFCFQCYPSNICSSLSSN